MFKRSGGPPGGAAICLASSSICQCDDTGKLQSLQAADQFVEVPGGRNNNNYGNVRLIVQVAERAGVDAVWPGWWGIPIGSPQCCMHTISKLRASAGSDQEATLILL